MTKTKPQVKIINCNTGEEIVQDANAEQIAEFAKIATDKAAAQVEAEAKEIQRQAILDRLGLTSDEARLLLGS
jgi:hypothetical protein